MHVAIASRHTCHTSSPTPSASAALPVLFYRVARDAGGVSCWVRFPWGVRQPLTHLKPIHALDGFEIGRGRPGTLELARCILAHYLWRTRVPAALYRAFAEAFLAEPMELGPDARRERDITTGQVERWLEQRTEAELAL